VQRDECAFGYLRCDSLACTHFVQSESAAIFIQLNYDIISWNLLLVTGKGIEVKY